MARKKSLSEILAQRNRIARELRMRGIPAGSQNDARYQRVNEIATRYTTNIINSKLWQRESGKEGMIDGVVSRKFSQRTYMGRVNG